MYRGGLKFPDPATMETTDPTTTEMTSLTNVTPTTQPPTTERPTTELSDGQTLSSTFPPSPITQAFTEDDTVVTTENTIEEETVSTEKLTIEDDTVTTEKVTIEEETVAATTEVNTETMPDTKSIVRAQREGGKHFFFEKGNTVPPPIY